MSRWRSKKKYVRKSYHSVSLRPRKIPLGMSPLVPRVRKPGKPGEAMFLEQHLRHIRPTPRSHQVSAVAGRAWRFLLVSHTQFPSQACSTWPAGFLSRNVTEPPDNLVSLRQRLPSVATRRNPQLSISSTSIFSLAAPISSTPPRQYVLKFFSSSFSM